MKKFLHLLALFCLIVGFNAPVFAKTYTLELTLESLGLNGTSYAANNVDHTVTAKASDGTTKDIVIYTYQQMLQSKAWQWQKKNAYLYNKTDLGNIKTIKINSSAGGYNVYYGTSENPTKTVSISNGSYNIPEGNGYFKINENNTATGTVTSIEITFELEDTTPGGNTGGGNTGGETTEPEDPSSGSYMIKFDETRNDSGQKVADNNAVLTYIVEGKDYVDSTSPTNLYEAPGGIKFGASSSLGSLTLKLSEKGQVNVTKIVVNAQTFGTDNSSIKINNGEAKSLSSSFKDYEYLFNGEKLSEIKIDITGKRGYVKYITIYYGDEKNDFTSTFKSKYDLTIDETVDLYDPANAPNITFSSNYEDFYSIEKGKLKGLKPGSTMVNAEWPEDDNWLKGNASFTVTVKSTGPKLGSEENPYTVDDLKSLSAETSETGVWLEGYIIGSVVNNNLNVGSTSSSVDTNLALGSTAGESSVYIPVELPKTLVRTDLNVKDNPTNIGRHVLLYGNIEKYFGMTGFKGVTQYKFLDEPVIKQVATPTISANGNEVKDNDVLPDGTEVTIDCATEGATLTGFITFTENEDLNKVLDNIAVPYTFIVKGEDIVEVEVLASANGMEDSEELSVIFEVAAPVVVTPSAPVVMIGEDVLTSGENKTVASGTILTITSENATSIKGTYNDDEFELTKEPFEYSITEDGTITIYGANGTEKSEEFTYTFTIGQFDNDMPGVGSNFRQMFKDTELPLTEGYYVIGRHFLSENNPVNVAMGRTFNNGNFNSSTNVTFIDDVPTIRNGNDLVDGAFTVMTVTGDDVLIVKLEKNQDEQWAIKTVNMGDGFTSSQKYLSLEDKGKTAFKLSDEFTPVSIEFTDYKNAQISFDEDAGRLVTYNTNGTFNNQATKSANVQLYRYTEKNVYTPDFEPVSLAEGKTTEQPLSPKTLIENAPAISYRVKGNTTLIAIQEDNRVKAQERSGNASIIASWADDDVNKWFAGRVEIPVTVKKVLITDANENGEFYFRHSEIRGKKEVGVAAQAVYYSGTGKVTYSISREGLEDASGEISINPETGMIRPTDLVAPLYSQLIVIDDEDNLISGRENPYTVTATVEETDEHLAATTSYTIYIEEGEQPQVAVGDVTFDFAKKGYGMFKFDSASSAGSAPYERNANEVKDNENHVPVFEFSEGAVNIKMNEDSRYRWLEPTSGQTEFRLYSDAIMTISSPTGNISSITFTLSNQTANQLSYFDSDGKEVTFSNGYSATWNSSSDKGDSSVKFKAVGTVRIKSIEVHSLQPSSGSGSLQDLELGFNDEDRIVNIFAEEEKVLPELLYNSELIDFASIEFDIDEIAEMDEDKNDANYVISRDDENEIVKVTVNDPGVYTFRAFYHGADYLNGAAILRLNVFPHLSVVPTEEGQLANDNRTDVPGLTLVNANNDEHNGAATISLPSIDELFTREDGHRYTTINVSSVVIKHGNDEVEFKLDENNNLVNDKMEAYPSHFTFTEDGSVTYEISYANTADFTGKTTVHVVLMPEIDLSVESGVNDNTFSSATLKPYNNAELWIYEFISDSQYPDKLPAGAPAMPDLNAKNAAKKKVTMEATDGNEPEYDTWRPISDNENGFTVDTQNVDEEGKYYAVAYMGIKDLSNIIDGYADKVAGENTDPILATPVYFLTNDELTGPTGVEEIEAADEAEAIYFNLQGVRVANPDKGVYIIVRGDKTEKVIF